MHCSTIAQQAWDAEAVISRLPYQCTTNRVDVNWTITVIIRFQTSSVKRVVDFLLVRYCGQGSSLLWTPALRPLCRSNAPAQGCRSNAPAQGEEGN